MRQVARLSCSCRLQLCLADLLLLIHSLTLRVGLPDKNTHNSKLRNDVTSLNICELMAHYKVFGDFGSDTIH